MFSRYLLCSRRSTLQPQCSTRYFSLRRPVSVKRPQPNSVRRDSSPYGLGWLFFDLHHIRLNHVRPLDFFGLHELPQPSVAQELLSVVDADAMQQDDHHELIHLVELALIPDPNTPVVPFTSKLFEVVGYAGEGRVAYHWMDLPLVLGGKLKRVKPDVCVSDWSRNEILLVAQEHKMTELMGLDEARIRLVAGAIAAFDHNNLQRIKARLPPLAEKVIPGIIMAGTSPAFFKIPVTETLSSHIRNGTNLPCETIVTYCYTPVPPDRRHEGMKPLDNRLEILKCCEAFKVFVG